MQEEEISKCVDEIEHFNSKNVSLETYVPEFLSKKEAESYLLFYEKSNNIIIKLIFMTWKRCDIRLLISEKSALAKLQEQFSLLSQLTIGILMKFHFKFKFTGWFHSKPGCSRR